MGMLIVCALEHRFFSTGMIEITSFSDFLLQELVEKSCILELTAIERTSWKFHTTGLRDVGADASAPHLFLFPSFEVMRKISLLYFSVYFRYFPCEEVPRKPLPPCSPLPLPYDISHDGKFSASFTFCFFQNNVLELWSLFDFLMPGFLGSEKKFQTQYGKPILMSRDAKSSSKEQEEGENCLIISSNCQL